MYFISCVFLSNCVLRNWSTLAAFWCDNWVRKTFPQYWVAQRSNAKLLWTFGSESYDTFPTSRHSFVQNAGSNKSPKHAIYKVSTCKWLEPRGATLLSLCPSLNCRCKKNKTKKTPKRWHMAQKDTVWQTHLHAAETSGSVNDQKFFDEVSGEGGKKEKAFIESRLFSLWQFSICLSFSLRKWKNLRNVAPRLMNTSPAKGTWQSCGGATGTLPAESWHFWQSLNQKECEHSPGLTKPPARVMRGGSGGDSREARVSALLRNRGLLMNVSESLVGAVDSLINTGGWMLMGQHFLTKPCHC